MIDGFGTVAGAKEKKFENWLFSSVYLSRMSALQELLMTNPERVGTRTEASLQTRWSLIGRLKDMDDQESWQEFFDANWKLIYSVAQIGRAHV